MSRLLRSLGPVRQQVRLERIVLRLADGPLSVVAARSFLLRPGIHLDLDGGPGLRIWLYRPLTLRPAALWSLRWHDRAGWIAEVMDEHLGPSVLFGWQLRIES